MKKNKKRLVLIAGILIIVTSILLRRELTYVDDCNYLIKFPDGTLSRTDNLCRTVTSLPWLPWLVFVAGTAIILTALYKLTKKS